MLLIGASVNLSKVCCGQHVVRDPTTASYDLSVAVDLCLLGLSVEDIDTSRADMNALVSLN